MRICITLLFFLGCTESNGGRTNSSTGATTGTGGMHEMALDNVTGNCLVGARIAGVQLDFDALR